MSPNPPPAPPLPPNYDPHMLEANGQYQNKPVTNSLVIYLNVINTLTQLLLGAVVFSAFSIANIIGVASSFTQHIYLCVIGYVILMSQAILSFNTHAGWAHSLKYPQKKWIHAGMQVTGSIFAISGSIIRIIDIDEHFQSPHAITGLVAMLLTFLSLIGGILNFFFPGQNDAVFYKTVHTVLGGMTITFAYICLCLGINSFFKFVFGNINAYLTISFAVFALLGILISAFSRIIERLLRK